MKPEHVHRKQLSLESRRQPESGIVLILVLFLMPVLFGFGAIVLDIGYHTLILDELKAAADAAAFSGARSLSGFGDCPSQACWARSRMITLKTLAAHRVHGSKHRELDLSSHADYENDLMEELDLSHEKNLKVTVERGIWGRFPSGEPFRSLEDEDHDNGGRFLIANAVKVTIERPHTAYFIGRFFGFEAKSLERSSTAALDELGYADVSTFALAPCTLLKEIDGELIYHPQDLHLDDRLFRTTRDEGGQPVFSYRPQDPDDPQPPPLECEDNICPCAPDAFPQHDYLDINGAVGESGVYETTKTELAAILNKEDGMKMAAIGEPFAVFPPGLDDEGGSYPFSGVLKKHIFEKAGNPLFSEVFGGVAFPLEGGSKCKACQTANLVFGGCWGNRNFMAPDFDWEYGSCDPRVYEDHGDEKGVWKTRIALIETLGVERKFCDRYEAREGEPPYEWTIVGFMHAKLYDFEAGSTKWITGHGGTNTCVMVRARLSVEDSFFADSRDTYLGGAEHLTRLVE